MRKVFLFLLVCSSFCQAQTLDMLTAADLPLLDITTTDSIEPTADIAYPPEGQAITITNNKYITGRMVVTLKGDTLLDTGTWQKDIAGMKIKRRGNSTGANLLQHPYKLKLSVANDLLQRTDTLCKHKEWILMSMYTWNTRMNNSESNTLNLLGTTVCKIMGQSWTPDFEFVNMRLNGKYRGMYYLMEPVSRGDRRIDIKKSGFIVEHDFFWWNEDRYFRTDRDTPNNAFTYKYPDQDKVTPEREAGIQRFINTCEKAIYQQTDSLEKYVDIESFARWLLIHDLLATDDVAGANRFLVRHDSLTSPLQMGPVWDFDSAFRSNLNCSQQRFYNDFYFPQLLQLPVFKAKYDSLWNNVRTELPERLTEALDAAERRWGNCFDNNMKLHRQLFKYEGQNSFSDQIAELKEKILAHIDSIDILLNHYQPTRIEPATTTITIYSQPNYQLNGKRINRPKKGIYIQNRKKYVIH